MNPELSIALTLLAIAAPRTGARAECYNELDAMRAIFVVGRDWKFRALLRAELREQGYEALGFETLEEAADALVGGSAAPAALVFDTTEASAKDTRTLLTALAESGKARPIVVVAATQEEFEPDSFTILRRPLQVADVLRVVKRLLEPHP